MSNHLKKNEGNAYQFYFYFFQLHLFLLNAFSSSNLIKFNKRNILSSRTSNRHLFLSSSLATRVTFQPRGLNPYHLLPTPFDIGVNVSVNPGHPRVGGDTPSQSRKEPPFLRILSQNLPSGLFRRFNPALVDGV
ncbi:hypothetical protein TNCV_2876561 [Trichonephila clavipes]|nr:hypothetical protein TNCV_2876561 [Trichonephila clavipes]